MLLLVTFFITVTETLTKVNVKRSKINSKAKLVFPKLLFLALGTKLPHI